MDEHRCRLYRITTEPTMSPIECKDDAEHLYCPHAVEIATISTKLDHLTDMVKELRDHVKAQNGRVGKLESAVTRLNLIVFSIGGSVGAVAVSYIFKLFGG